MRVARNEGAAPGRTEILLLALAVLALTWIGFSYYPGRTILQSDTQIYLPILEHLSDPSLFRQDPIAVRPHVGFTIYDETARALRAISGAGFESVLAFEQFCFRVVGVCGLILMGTAFGLTHWQALLSAAVVSLSVFVAGPAVIIVELEPVPRGFSLPFLLLSLGLQGTGRWTWAGVSAGIAFLFHPPTALLYCVAFAGFAGWRKQWPAAGAAVFSMAALGLMAIAQNSGAAEGPRLFGTIDSALEDLMRLRASYNWVSIWWGRWWKHYLAAFAIACAAFVRLKSSGNPVVRQMSWFLIVSGLLSVPLSYLLLERAKWVFIPEWQPGRYLLFVTLFAIFGGSVQGIRAAVTGRYGESFLFFTLAYALTLNSNVLDVLVPGSTLAVKRLILALAMAGAAVLLVRIRTASRWRPAMLSAMALAPFVLVPLIGEVRNYAPLHSPEIDSLALWARAETPVDSVFQFSGFGQGLQPGVFRARSRRALYVDWKSGGQLNFLREFAFLWWSRWQMANAAHTADEFRALGVDYLVVQPKDKIPGKLPVFENTGFTVYRLSPSV